METNEIESVASKARNEGLIGIDTEFMRERTYRARLCLLQIASRSEIFLIDAVDGSDLKPVAELVGDPEVEVVVHAGRQDLELFYESFGVVPRSVFDVQLAAGFAGYGASASYGALVRAVLGVSLTKGESYTDWCRRPLTDKQRRYAADDVRYLLDMADALRAKLESLGRAEWAMEEMRTVEAESTYKTDLDESWRRVSGRNNLSGRQLAVLKEVARWREEVAAQRDVPRGWLVKDASLIEIARRQPSSLKALGDIRGLNQRELHRSGKEIIDAVSRGKTAPPPEIAPAPPRDQLARIRLVGAMADVIVRSRADKAGVAPELVATRAEIEAVLLDEFSGRKRRHRLLEGWRNELAGSTVIDVARGRVALKTVGEPPYVEEVQS